MNDNVKVDRIIIDALTKQYPKAIADLRLEWRDKGYLDMPDALSEDEYIITRLPTRLEQLRQAFTEYDQSSRLAGLAAEFKIKHNPKLWQKHYPTGFKLLDDALGGGFTAGVHYIGAISSLGKSTIALQMMDQMAADGTQCIYVSLEMRRIDLTAKLVSMHTYLDTPEQPKLAKTMTMLLNQEISSNFTDKEWSIITNAADKVQARGRNISILESQTKPVTVDDIAYYIDRYVSTYNVKPVVIIDYLQILAPSEQVKGYSDKQVVDYNITKFRSLAATYDIPIIVISSFNRGNYNVKVSQQAFKESGNIEYSADSLIGLQFAGINEDRFDMDEAKLKYPRDVELVILKQRYGPSNYTISYKFYTKYNYFQEVEWVKLPQKVKTPFEQRQHNVKMGSSSHKNNDRIV